MRKEGWRGKGGREQRPGIGAEGGGPGWCPGLGGRWGPSEEDAWAGRRGFGVGEAGESLLVAEGPSWTDMEEGSGGRLEGGNLELSGWGGRDGEAATA